MQEFVEIRVYEKFARQLFDETTGESVGALTPSVRKLIVSTQSEKFRLIRELNAKERLATGKSVFSSWRLLHTYGKSELESARYFCIDISSIFEPSGEECGTLYDETSRCGICSSGDCQVGNLIISTKNIGRNIDVARSIAGEILVSTRFCNILSENNISGAVYGAIESRSGVINDNWRQLKFVNSMATVSNKTKTGIDPFDDDLKNEYRCPRGDLIGLRLLSELYILSDTLPKLDIFQTKQFFGLRSGLLRPQRAIIVSKKLQSIFLNHKIRRLGFDVAHVV